MSEKTIGEVRVRTSFNPSSNSKVDQIKQKTAELINLTETLTNEVTQEKINEFGYDHFSRMLNNATKAYEEAAMWAVKLATA